MSTTGADARAAWDGLVADVTGPGARVPVARVLDVVDGLPAVEPAEMLGSWRGGGLATGHPWDGLLEACGWHGKRFASAEDVDPLVFEDARGLFAVNPALVPLGLLVRHPGLGRSGAARAVARRCLRAARTRRPAARLRRVEHRGVLTATMVYDALPVQDHFRRVDDGTVVGVMDMRGMRDPFVFTLHRE
ncbi:GXWXG domain-containing protein [Cellulomonas sp. SLBN-39]|uniref:GXWXG domain-containing protein n=1 Tax=Cellulomonas sp. SLBN-39 TaxID=2768446 RepID=UPI00115168CE|nr:GXWXG domain-containing protein [Cellulomonas sp. SLBN-39]TQL03493.1 uncharacterized protein DUF4334 [Cellulomonas sp. SLBN-39]